MSFRKILYVISLIYLSGCLEKISEDNIIELDSSFEGRFIIHNKERSLQRSILFNSDKSLEIGFSSASPDNTRQGRWIKLDSNLIQEQSQWYNTKGQVYYKSNFSGSRFISFEFFDEHLDINSIEFPLLLQSNIPGEDSKFERILFVDYPIVFIHFKANFMLKDTEINRYNNCFIIRGNRSEINHNSHIVVSYLNSNKEILRADTLNLAGIIDF